MWFLWVCDWNVIAKTRNCAKCATPYPVMIALPLVFTRGFTFWGLHSQDRAFQWWCRGAPMPVELVRGVLASDALVWGILRRGEWSSDPTRLCRRPSLQTAASLERWMAVLIDTKRVSLLLLIQHRSEAWPPEVREELIRFMSIYCLWASCLLFNQFKLLSIAVNVSCKLQINLIKSNHKKIIIQAFMIVVSSKKRWMYIKKYYLILLK